MRFRDNIKSPNDQPLMYLAEYADGSFVTEFNTITGKKQPVQNLKEEGMIRFGITGMGVPAYVETYGGYFHIAGKNVQVKYVANGIEHYLIGHPRFYTNVEYFKSGSAELALSPKAEVITWGKPEGEIDGFHFGYSENILAEGVNFTFKAICNIPFMKAVTMTFELHADVELDGELVVMYGGEERYRDSAPIDPIEGGKIEWHVK